MAEPIKPWKAIVAMADKNRVIGKDGALPWRLPEDLAFFKKTTLGSTVVMGRRVMEEVKRPLPKRRNLVLTQQQEPVAGFTFIRSLDEIDAYAAGDPVFIIGGARLYEATFPLCAELYVTHVKGDYDGDTFLPPFEHLYDPVETLQESEALKIVRYRNKQAPGA
ncbi:MAG: dihydrofolate reductase [Verrucomicrobiota bacterium]